MVARRVPLGPNSKKEKRSETVLRNAAPRRLKSRGIEAAASAATRDGEPRWRCLRSRIAVAVAPLRNPTGDIGQTRLGEVFTQDLISELVEHGRGFTVQRSSGAPGSIGPTDRSAESEAGYVVTGSVQRGGSEMLRVNVQIADTETSEYLWAHRYEFGAQEPTLSKTKIIRRISRELHLLLLREEINRASLDLDSEPELDECLSSAATALGGELRADLTADAQRWYLAALADDPRNVEALVGLARTCQELVSNPWWGDPLAASLAPDLGREVVAIALDLAPGAADAHCVQGMLYSAAGKLDEAEHAFEQALAMDQG